MKKLITIALLTLLTACAQPDGSSMDKAMMCDQCPCCKEMMKDGKECSCCKDMKECCCKSMGKGKMCNMGEGMKQDVKKPLQSLPNHSQHH